ncbi:MAG TPA: TadE/TadG family type IV pilus assembly protein [Gemmata sp.]|nr:TadE/TadG family type IV pilus assembly protein [Gemmata sp.]
MLLRRKKRTGAILIESALVYPVLFMLVFGIVLLGMSVFRYQQVAHAAREGARYAIVRGARYSEETNLTAATAADIFANGIQPYVAGMNPPNLTYAVSWNADNKQTSSQVMTVNGEAKIVTIANKVSVTVTYTWNTGLFGSVPVSSTCVMTMSF